MQADYDSQIENGTVHIIFNYGNTTGVNSTNSTLNDSKEEFDPSFTILVVSVFFISFCIISAIVNVRILICTKWIRTQLTPTLFISVSLALADAYLSVLLGLGFFMNSFLPNGLNLHIFTPCLTLTLEAFRLSAILISTIHLLVLAGNHYLGILCPFLSIRWLTHKNLLGVLIFVWILPTVFIFTYFSMIEGEGYQTTDCMEPTTYNFLKQQHFRMVYSGMFFVPLILMFIIYFHISIIVRRHQTGQLFYNRQHSRRHDPRTRNDQEQQYKNNIKAIWTSLLILSTYIICFMPAVILYIILCDDCYYKLASTNPKITILTATISNFLLISKPLINPLIYASRMNEIRVATRRMNEQCRGNFCLFVSSDELDRHYNSSGAGDFYHGGRSSRISRINQCSMNSMNGFSRSFRRNRTDDLTADL